MTLEVETMSFDWRFAFLVFALHMHLVLHLAQHMQQELMRIMLLERIEHRVGQPLQPDCVVYWDRSLLFAHNLISLYHHQILMIRSPHTLECIYVVYSPEPTYSTHPQRRSSVTECSSSTTGLSSCSKRNVDFGDL